MSISKMRGRKETIRAIMRAEVKKKTITYIIHRETTMVITRAVQRMIIIHRGSQAGISRRLKGMGAITNNRFQLEAIHI